MVSNEILDSKLEKIFDEIIGIDFAKNKELKNEKLLGKKVGLTARELVHLYYLIEEEFKIEIPDEVILEGKFDIYNNILEIISKCIINKY